MARLATGIWVSAYMARLRQVSLAHYLTARGDPMAGAVLIKIIRSQGVAVIYERIFDRNWAEAGQGVEAEIDAAIARKRARDPDLWVIEVEDQHGLGLLDDPAML